NLPETVPKEHVGRPGYLGHLAENVVTVATILRGAGYHTYMAGKWHLGHTPGALPDGQGFERSFALDATGGDNWEQRGYLPIYETADWFEDGKAVRLPERFYSSEFLVDRVIDYIDGGRSDGRPFFVYLPFLAIHIPIQAPREFSERYDGIYDGGWAVQRERRYRGAIKSGLIAADTPLGPPPAGLRDWSALSPDEKRFQAKSMAVNAGMLEAMDHHLGRLVTHLRESGAFENTLFIVMSDNGAESGDPAASAAFRRWLDSVGYSRDVEHLGEKGTFTAIGPEAANANVAPGALFKFYAAEGGVRVPLVMSGPGIPAGRTQRAFAYITDLAPTILDFAAVSPPVGPAPMTGRSLRPVLSGSADAVHPDDEPIGMEAAGSAALWKGAHKLVKDLPPYSDGQWRLYDIVQDPGETRDLKSSEAARFDELLRDYQRFAAKVGVLEVPEGYTTFGQLGANMGAVLVRRYAIYLAGAGLLLLALVAWLARALWRRLV
ncbi:MAG: sulfatase-like hydrolase/transferase, partial [bacterium]